MSETQRFILYTDGGARGNPGNAGAGWVITDASGNTFKTGSKFLGEQTNNWAEYEAVALALAELKKLVPKAERKDAAVEVRLDSELVTKQLQGKYQIKEASLFPQFIKVWNLRVADFPNLTFAHIPREENAHADALANEAMDTSIQKGLL